MLNRILSALTIATLCGASFTAQAALIHESDFDEADTNIDPVGAGDVTAISATGTHVVGHPNGYWDYPGDGTLLLHHPGWEWDDSSMEFDSATIGSSAIATSSPIEFQFDLDTNFITTAGENATVEIMVTDAGTPANAEVLFWLHTDAGDTTYVSFVAGGGDANGSKTQIGTSAADIDDVKVIINHDPTAGEWRAFYQINGGSLFEVPSGAVADATRTTTCLRVECDNTPWAGTMDEWEMIAKNLQIYDTIETTGEVLVVGEVLRHSDFNEAAGSIASNWWLPISAGDVDALYQGSHEYDGTAWVISHDGDLGDNWNAGIGTIEDGSAPAEWVFDINTAFATDGIGQMFNIKLDGADASMYVANLSGAASGINIIFGEAADIFNPAPENVAALTNDASTLTTLRLIFTYDPVEEEYNGFYAENGGAVVPHPGNPVAKVRTDGNIELQWQVWNSAATTAFDIGMEDYQEQYGISTVDDTNVDDFMLLD